MAVAHSHQATVKSIARHYERTLAAERRGEN
jgi:hypothetical protein